MTEADRTALRARAETLRALHTAPEPLVLVNVWDVASARLVAATPGCKALATGSWAIADVHGYPDGEAIPLPLTLAAIQRIAAASELPLSADLEAGYGDVGATVLRAIDAGAVGCNLEDSGPNGLVSAQQHANAVATAVAAGQATGVPVVVNARCDVYLKGDKRLDDAIARGQAYLEEGADCVFVPGLADRDAIAALGRAFEGKLSILAGPGSPPLAELAGLGVARVSFGNGTHNVALAALADAARTLLSGGDYPDTLGFRRPG